MADKRYKNFVILFFSIIFYSWGAPKFIFVLLGTTFLDFHLVHFMYNSTTDLKRRLVLVFSILMNVGLLFYFKYCNFFIDNLNSVFDYLHFHFNLSIRAEHIKLLEVVMPIGISFYTFETLTYVIDVYRRVHAPLKKFWDYQTYIILFPKLIAGPIIRYHEIADQINDREQNDTIDNKLTGFFRFIIGLCKKVLIANVMGKYATTIFNQDYHQMSSSLAWVGILAYTFQIYFDFSGYSDMAIGLGRMMGFEFPENFNNPYTSQSITEFWKRWHITLGNWMKNYLYIPLGGNRVGSKWRLFFNLWLVFLISGFWHGASWCFIIWGAYHGLFLVLERGFLLNLYKKIPSFIRMVLTFLIVVTGWVFFRVEDIHKALAYLKTMYGFKEMKPTEILFHPTFYYIFSLSILFSFFTFSNAGKKLQERLYATHHSAKASIFLAFAAIFLFVLCISNIAAEGFNPFIYFRF
ncbi:MAG: MBOAT family O-acyltransferase [Bacteroidota bacterium]